MKNKLLKNLMIGGMILSLLPITSFSAFAESSETEITSEAEQEKIYEEAYDLVSKKYDYEKAIELLKKIRDYKDSKELIERYEKMQTNRFINGRFYWFPEEYVKVLKENLKDIDDTYNNIQVTEENTSNKKGINKTITISYDTGSTDVILYDVQLDDNGNPNSFGSVEIRGTQGDLITTPAVIVIATLRGDSTIETARDIALKMVRLNPQGEFSQDNFKYTFNNDGKTISFLIEPVKSDVASINGTSSNIGIDLTTFVTRYNQSIDEYNATTKYSDFNKTVHITENDFQSDDFSPSGNMKLTVNPNTTNKSPVGIINVWAENRNPSNTDVSLAEITAMIFAFDVQLTDSTEALDIWNQLCKTNEVTQDGITFDNYSVDDMIVIKAQYDGFEISD